MASNHYRDVIIHVMASQITGFPIDPSHKSQNASVPYPTMQHFVTEMCTHVHISVTKWCIVGYMSGTLWDLWDGFIVCSTICSGADQSKHQSSASLAFVRGIHWWPMDSPHKGPVMQKMFPFDDAMWRMWNKNQISNSQMNPISQPNRQTIGCLTLKKMDCVIGLHNIWQLYVKSQQCNILVKSHGRFSTKYSKLTPEAPFTNMV